MMTPLEDLFLFMFGFMFGVVTIIVLGTYFYVKNM
jgi:hypothetical protein